MKGLYISAIFIPIIAFLIISIISVDTLLTWPTLILALIISTLISLYSIKNEPWKKIWLHSILALVLSFLIIFILAYLFPSLEKNPTSDMAGLGTAIFGLMLAGVFILSTIISLTSKALFIRKTK